MTIKEYLNQKKIPTFSVIQGGKSKSSFSKEFVKFVENRRDSGEKY